MCVYCLYKLYVQSTHMYSFLKRKKNMHIRIRQILVQTSFLIH